jgi:hypothetical protein
MQAMRFWVLLLVAVLGSGAFAACADGDVLPSHPQSNAGAATDGGAPAGGKAVTVAGSGGRGGASGTSTTPEGGTAAGAAVGGDANGGVGGEGDGGAGGALNGEGGEDGEQLMLCARLSGQTVLAGRMAHDFEVNVYYDCRVSWLVVKGHALDDFLVSMTSFNYAFWGCANLPVTTFGLVDGQPSLSAADVATLAEDYVAAMNTSLLDTSQNSLSAPEAVEMTAALERLAKPLVTNPAATLSQSLCNSGAGGAAGAGGAP